MKKTIIILVVLLFSGCTVSKMKTQNWIPNNQDRNQAHYECLQQSYQDQSISYSNQDFSATRSDRKANKELLVSCMQARGYYLRGMTGSEKAISVITLPLAIPFAIIGTDLEIF